MACRDEALVTATGRQNTHTYTHKRIKKHTKTKTTYVVWL